MDNEKKAQKDFIHSEGIASNFINNQLELEKMMKELSDVKYALDQSSIVGITNQRGIILSVNKNFCEISQYDEAELIGQNHRILNSNYHDKSFFKEMWATIGQGNTWRGRNP